MKQIFFLMGWFFVPIMLSFPLTKAQRFENDLVSDVREFIPGYGVPDSFSAYFIQGQNVVVTNSLLVSGDVIITGTTTISNLKVQELTVTTSAIIHNLVAYGDCVVTGSLFVPYFQGNVLKTGDLILLATTGPSSGVISQQDVPLLHTYGVKNIFLGAGAGDFLLTGSNNVGIGVEVLAKNTTGNGNTAVGDNALISNMTGSTNSVVGYQALHDNSSGSDNTAIGYNALIKNMASENIAVGSGALQGNIDGMNNTAIGYQALYSSVSCNDNTAIGYQSGDYNSIGNDNTTLGAMAGATMRGSRCIFVGSGAGYNESFFLWQPDDCTGVGFNVLSNLGLNGVSGLTAIGSGALEANTNGMSNSAIGFNAMTSNTIGLCNTAVGLDALMNNVTGNNNTAIGCNTLMTNTIASDCTAIGYNALAQNMASENTAVGSSSLTQNISGLDNIAIGFDAFSTNTSGSDNTAIGVGALNDNTSGNYNVAVGNGALAANTNNQFNTAIGYQAGQNSTGYSNTFVGINAGSAVTNASELIVIGNIPGSDSISNATYIAHINETDVGETANEVYVNNENWVSATWLGLGDVKENCTIAEEDCEKLLNLRPACVVDTYDVQHKQKYGLFLEEVEQEFPELMYYDKKGRSTNILYQYLQTLMLNEVQRQHICIQKQQLVMDQQQKRLNELCVQFEALKGIAYN